jgi:hypothetical protein
MLALSMLCAASLAGALQVKTVPSHAFMRKLFANVDIVAGF